MPSPSGYGSIAVDEAAVDVAKSYISEKFTKFTEFSKSELKNLKKYADDGHWTWSILGLVAGIVISSVHVLSILGNLFSLSPFNAVLDVYLVIFGVAAIILEYKNKLLTSKYLQILRKQALFLYQPYGRAAFYFFIGVLLTVKGGFLDFFVGLYTTLVGVVVYIGSTQALKALNEAKANGTLNEHEITKKFYEFDKNGNGSIDSEELSALCKSININLSENELESALFILDADSNGSITLEEFKIWLNVSYGAV